MICWLKSDYVKFLTEMFFTYNINAESLLFYVMKKMELF